MSESPESSRTEGKCQPGEILGISVSLRTPRTRQGEENMEQLSWQAWRLAVIAAAQSKVLYWGSTGHRSHRPAQDNNLSAREAC